MQLHAAACSSRMQPGGLAGALSPLTAQTLTAAQRSHTHTTLTQTQMSTAARAARCRHAPGRPAPDERPPQPHGSAAPRVGLSDACWGARHYLLTLRPGAGVAREWPSSICWPLASVHATAAMMNTNVAPLRMCGPIIACQPVRNPHTHRHCGSTRSQQ